MVGTPKTAALLFMERLAAVCLFTAGVSTMSGCGEDEGTKPGTEEPGGGETPEPNPPQDADGNCNVGFWDHDQNKDTVCEPWSICQPGEYVDADGSKESDRLCAPCAEGSFSDSENQASCEAWTVCENGAYIVELGSDISDVICEVCPEGTFDDDNDPTTACAPKTTCEPGQFVSDEGSDVDDRTCGSCEEGTYTDAANLPQCLEVTDCEAGTFYEGEASTQHNTICTPCAEGTWDHDADPSTECVEWSYCNEGEFISTVGTPTSDQACSAWTTCVQGEYVSAQGSLVSDRECSACLAGTYSSTSNAAACEAWAVCEAGTYVQTLGTETSNRVCSECEWGTFSTDTNQSSCDSQRYCEPGSYVTDWGSRSSNVQCASCPEGKISTYGNSDACWDPTDCAPGQYVGVEFTPSSDRHCGNCGSGTFTNVFNAPACQPWTVCPAGTTRSGTANTTTDYICTPCEAGKWDHDGNQTTACVAHTVCQPGNFISQAGTTTANAQCSACPTGTFSAEANESSCEPWAVTSCEGRNELVAPSATQDGVCQPWIRHLTLEPGNISYNIYTRITGLAADSEGNVIIGGSIRDSIALPILNIPASSVGVAYIAKFNKQGQLIWSLVLPTIDTIAPWSVAAIAVNQDDAIVATGDGQKAGVDISWVAIINSDGDVERMTSVTPFEGGTRVITGDIATNNFNEIVVGGFEDSAPRSTMSYSSKALLMKFDGDLNLEWHRILGGPAKNEVSSVEINDNGIIAAAATIPNPTGTPWASGSTISPQAVTLLYNADGDLLWSTRDDINQSGGRAPRVAIAPTGEVVTGYSRVFSPVEHIIVVVRNIAGAELGRKAFEASVFLDVANRRFGLDDLVIHNNKIVISGVTRASLSGVNGTYHAFMPFIAVLKLHGAATETEGPTYAELISQHNLHEGTHPTSFWLERLTRLAVDGNGELWFSGKTDYKYFTSSVFRGYFRPFDFD